jgi:hypothetical protein
MNEDQKHEEWRPVKGYEGIYSISSLGRLRRDPATFKHGPNKIHNGFTRKVGPSAGYVFYCLNRDGKEVNRSAHRLVAEAFLKPDKRRPHVNHKNGQKSDNRPENLEWCTPKENIHHAIEKLGFKPGKHGKSPRGEAHYNHKLTDIQVQEIKLRSATHERKLDIAKAYGVSRMTVIRIQQGNTRISAVKMEQHEGNAISSPPVDNP